MWIVKGFDLAAITFHDRSWILIHSTCPLYSPSLPQPSCIHAWKAGGSSCEQDDTSTWTDRKRDCQYQNQFVIRYWTGFRVFLTLFDGHQNLNRIHFHCCSTAMIEPLNFKEKKETCAIVCKCTLSCILIRIRRKTIHEMF